MVRFIIVRHGFSCGNKEKRYSGHRDVPLAEAGIRQAEETACYIEKSFKVDRIYSSDLSRAYDTVFPLAERLGLTITKLEALREIHLGHWQGLSPEEVQACFPESYEMSRKIPGLIRFDGGESYIEVMDRAKTVFERIAEENDGKTVVCGTHGGIIRALLTVWEGLPPERLHEIPDAPNASVTVAEYEKGKVSILKRHYIGHLTENVSEAQVK